MASFTYGVGKPTLWSHALLNDATHDWLKAEFGPVPLTFFDQMSRCIRAGQLVAVDGFAELPATFASATPRTDARIVLLAGERQPVFLPESQERTFDLLQRHGSGDYAVHVFPDYGHLDMFMGKDAARDVFPTITRSTPAELRQGDPWAYPRRIDDETGRYSLVDGIPFQLPVASHHSPALMAVFTIDAQAAAGLLPGQELHPLRLPGGRGVLVITVIDYTSTNIGKYIEFSIAIGVTHGRRPAPPLLPLLLQRHYDMGQYVYDLPVSTEISVKGGKGIWGMPKHQANLDFQIGRRTVSSQYDLDGQLAMRITIRKPRWTGLPLRMGSSNFCAFRGMLCKSSLYFHGQIGLPCFAKGRAELLIGDSPRTAPLKASTSGLTRC